MKLTFLGAAQEVTGSMHFLQLAAGNILVDCGMVQGRREESRRRNQVLPNELGDTHAIVLTHAHLDHAGSLPTLVKSGYRGPIYATPATIDLCEHMLADSAHIQKQDADYLNKKFADEPGYVPITPLYDAADVQQVLQQFVGVAYHQAFAPLPGVSATLIDAGHILGSAQLVLEVGERQTTRRLLFSGDLGRKDMPILRDPEHPVGPLDYVIMESTYGDRAHAPIQSMHAELKRVIHDAIARGGKIIVPAFAVGRTQELIYALHELRQRDEIPALPIFVDSPLAIQATEVFSRHPECFDRDVRDFQNVVGGSAFGFAGLRFLSTREESMELNGMAGPAIIVSAAGMAEGGRILHHLRNNIEDPRNTILIVGFMAQHTLGRRLVERRPWVKIWGIERELRAKVEVLNAFSAHADCNDLLAYARACGAETREFFLVHGEPPAQRALMKTMLADGLRVRIPARGDTVTLA